VPSEQDAGPLKISATEHRPGRAAERLADSQTVATLDLGFVSRGLEGVVKVTMEANEDPVTTGHDLIAADFDREAFAGFPVVCAEVVYPGLGPRGIFYWVQTVTHEGVNGSRDARVDAVHPPFYLFGYRPTFMDAPANPDHPDMDWIARTFLAEDPRVVGSSTLRPLTGFAWGYRLRNGSVTSLIAPREYQDEDWTSVRDTYATEYPGLRLLPLQPEPKDPA
jgi:hypothetical protein